jgi:hypothetical protein
VRFACLQALAGQGAVQVLAREGRVILKEQWPSPSLGILVRAGQGGSTVIQTLHATRPDHPLARDLMAGTTAEQALHGARVWGVTGLPARQCLPQTRGPARASVRQYPHQSSGRPFPQTLAIPAAPFRTGCCPFCAFRSQDAAVWAGHDRIGAFRHFSLPPLQHCGCGRMPPARTPHPFPSASILAEGKPEPLCVLHAKRRDRRHARNALIFTAATTRAKVKRS